MKNIGQQLLCAQWGLDEIQRTINDSYYHKYAQPGELEKDIQRVLSDTRLAMEAWDDQAGSSE